MDNLTTSQRKKAMSSVKSRNTSIELKVVSHLARLHQTIQQHDSDLPGCPDIIIRRKKYAIFVNGCFWHNHSKCKRSELPKTNRLFWKKKISRNMKRDKAAYRSLNRNGWHYIVIWECRLTEGLEKLSKKFFQKRIPLD